MKTDNNALVAKIIGDLSKIDNAVTSLSENNVLTYVYMVVSQEVFVQEKPSAEYLGGAHRALELLEELITRIQVLQTQEK